MKVYEKRPKSLLQRQRRGWTGEIRLLCIVSLAFFAWIKWAGHVQFSMHKCDWIGKNSPACNINIARLMFNEKIARQSSTITEARKNYRQRYKRQPPPLFDTWVEFALENQSAIIDDYDQIEKDLAPFRLEKLTKSDWRKRIGSLKTFEPGEMLGTLSVIDGHAISMGPVKGTMSSATLEALVQPIAPFYRT